MIFLASRDQIRIIQKPKMSARMSGPPRTARIWAGESGGDSTAIATSTAAVKVNNNMAQLLFLGCTELVCLKKLPKSNK